MQYAVLFLAASASRLLDNFDMRLYGRCPSIAYLVSARAPLLIFAGLGIGTARLA